MVYHFLQLCVCGPSVFIGYTSLALEMVKNIGLKKTCIFNVLVIYLIEIHPIKLNIR